MMKLCSLLAASILPSANAYEIYEVTPDTDSEYVSVQFGDPSPPGFNLHYRIANFGEETVTFPRSPMECYEDCLNAENCCGYEIDEDGRCYQKYSPSAGKCKLEQSFHSAIGWEDENPEGNVFGSGLMESRTINGQPCKGGNIRAIHDACTGEDTDSYFTQPEGQVCLVGGTLTAYCSYDVGDHTCAYCESHTPTLSAECKPLYSNWIGDGICDSEGGYNTEECAWDGGDCCEETCVGSCYGGFFGFQCLDPRYAPAASSSQPTLSPTTSAPIAPENFVNEDNEWQLHSHTDWGLSMVLNSAKFGFTEEDDSLSITINGKCKDGNCDAVWAFEFGYDVDFTILLMNDDVGNDFISPECGGTCGDQGFWTNFDASFFVRAIPELLERPVEMTEEHGNGFPITFEFVNDYEANTFGVTMITPAHPSGVECQFAGLVPTGERLRMWMAPDRSEETLKVSSIVVKK